MLSADNTTPAQPRTGTVLSAGNTSRLEASTRPEENGATQLGHLFRAEGEVQPASLLRRVGRVAARTGGVGI